MSKLSFLTQENKIRILKPLFNFLFLLYRLIYPLQFPLIFSTNNLENQETMSSISSMKTPPLGSRMRFMYDYYK